MPNAILVGHSYIARMDAARFSHPDIPSDFNVKECSISFLAKGGARIVTIRNLTQTFARRQPHCIVLQIGGNDIQANMYNGIYIGKSAVDLAKHILRSTSCQQLCIGEMIFRFKGKYIKSVAEQDAYNQQVHAANCEIKSQLRGYNDIIFWPCKVVKRDKQLVMHHDGVHLSERNGMFKYDIIIICPWCYRTCSKAHLIIFANMRQNIMPDHSRLYIYTV